MYFVNVIRNFLYMVISLIILVIYALISFFLLYKSNVIEEKNKKIVAVLLLVMAFGVRYLNLNHVSQDYIIFLSEWIQTFKDNGGLKGLSESVGNYNIPYLAILALISYLNDNWLIAIKLISIFFDIVLAWSAMKIVEKCTNDKKKQLICFFAVLLLPTVIIDGSYWGQCDVIYVSLGILGINFALDNKPWLSMISIAMSFAFKLQAVFIMPIYAVLLMKRKVKWYHFIAFPIVYILMISPALIAGRPFLETLLLYTTQTDTVGTGYSYNAPSLLAIVDAGRTLLAFLNTDTAIPIVSKIATAVAMTAVIVLLVFALVNRDRISDYIIILTMGLLTVVIPYLLPHMHDRYFFCADVLTLILMIIDCSFAPVFILIAGSSLWCYFCYYRYIMTQATGSIYLGSFAIFIGLVYFILKYIRAINKDELRLKD